MIKCHAAFILKVAAFSGIGCLLLACASNTTEPDTRPKFISLSEASTPEYLLAQARQSKSPQRAASFHIQAARAYLKSEQTAQAMASLADVRSDMVNVADRPGYFMLKLDLALRLKDLNSLKQLEAERAFATILSQQKDPRQMTETVRSVAAAYKLLDQPLSMAILLAENVALFDAVELPFLVDETWQALRQVPAHELAQYSYTGVDANVGAWLDLANQIQLNQNNLTKQHQAFMQWKAFWSQHPLAVYAPPELSALAQLPDSQPRRIVLALPLSGQLSPVGLAVRNGFLASFYSEPQNQAPDQSIQFYDTAKFPIEDLYTQLQPDNALIVGPLDKTSINRIGQLDLIPVRTLALNYLSGTENRAQDNLIQFGLSPEQEAAQVALRLHEKNLQRVVVIAPENDLGMRIHDAFATAFSQLNGTILQSEFFTKQDELDDAVGAALGTAESEQRLKQLKAISRLPLEFEPRRRRDLDAIFIIATPEEAKQLNPLFAYNFSRDIPIYATSLIHDPRSNDNNDLNAIQFIQMPWLLSSSNELKATLGKALPAESENYTQFHALGADAFALTHRLPLLQNVSYSAIEGQTGLLTLKSGIVERAMQWTTFRNGKAVAVTE